jgi:flagellar biosynthesis/type III secretory pathway chaperone
MTLKELARRLENLASQRLEIFDFDRPKTPCLRKKELHVLVNKIANENLNLTSSRDLQLLNILVEEENEFIVAAFDVYESDKDINELCDTLKRLIRKCKQYNNINCNR